jgi:hypothetical protein
LPKKIPVSLAKYDGIFFIKRRLRYCPKKIPVSLAKYDGIFFG